MQLTKYSAYCQLYKISYLMINLNKFFIPKRLFLTLIIDTFLFSKYVFLHETCTYLLFFTFTYSQNCIKTNEIFNLYTNLYSLW